MKPVVRDKDFLLYQGDCREIVRGLPENRIDCVVTSPPYFGLRDYGTATWDGGRSGCTHKSAKKKTRYDYSLSTSKLQDGKRTGTDATTGMWSRTCPDCGAVRVDSQLGMEDSVGSYVHNLVDLFGDVRRTLADHATVWVNLGDSYDGGRLRGTPWRFAFSMVDDGWRLVRDVIWYKRDPMPESVKHRPTTAHEYLFMFTLSDKHYYDWYAVREDATSGEGIGGKRLMRSVWDITTVSYRDAHFATFPPALPARCITAGCPHRVCRKCGEPQRRIVESSTLDRDQLPRDHPEWRPSRYDGGKAGDPQAPGPGQRYNDASSTGWSQCGCDAPTRRGTVLDPFLGSGTTAQVARELGRTSVGIELNADYCDQIARRTSQLNLVNEQEVIL